MGRCSFITYMANVVDGAVGGVRARDVVEAMAHVRVWTRLAYFLAIAAHVSGLGKSRGKCSLSLSLKDTTHPFMDDVRTQCGGL